MENCTALPHLSDEAGAVIKSMKARSFGIPVERATLEFELGVDAGKFYLENHFRQLAQSEFTQRYKPSMRKRHSLPQNLNIKTLTAEKLVERMKGEGHIGSDEVNADFVFGVEKAIVEFTQSNGRALHVYEWRRSHPVLSLLTPRFVPV